MTTQTVQRVHTCRIPDFHQNTTHCYVLIIYNSTFHQLHAKNTGGRGSTWEFARSEHLGTSKLCISLQKDCLFLKIPNTREREQETAEARTANLSLQVVGSFALCALSIILHENLVHWTIQVNRYLQRWKMSQNVTKYLAGLRIKRYDISTNNTFYVFKVASWMPHLSSVDKAKYQSSNFSCEDQHDDQKELRREEKEPKGRTSEGQQSVPPVSHTNTHLQNPGRIWTPRWWRSSPPGRKWTLPRWCRWWSPLGSERICPEWSCQSCHSSWSRRLPRRPTPPLQPVGRTGTEVRARLTH